MSANNSQLSRHNASEPCTEMSHSKVEGAGKAGPLVDP